MSSSKGK